ncbi:MAG: T9SS type B sorting domain-containing protein [Bacteroidetes bacterium]|nr:T9SS type B sorting domain-containing protein [Bacteroidota bacterium]
MWCKITLLIGGLVLSLAARAQEGCSGNLGENIFEEGDFSRGPVGIVPSDPGIAPGYTYDPTPPPGDGFYILTSGFGSWDWFFGGWFNVASDNSDDPNGYMMVVNADLEPGVFYEQTVDGLCANTLYYGFTFTTGPNTTSLTLTLRNNAPGGIGNDLAIDNIAFRACGPEALILPREVENICEDGQPIPLTATILGDQFPDPAIQWQRSPDGGTTWEDIPGATGQSIMHTQLAGGFYYYRYLLANSPVNLANPKCYIISNVKVVFVQPKFYEIVDTICDGADYLFGDRALTQTGVYVDSLTSSLGCDSIVTLQLTQVPDPGIRADIEVSDTRCADSQDGVVRVEGLQNAAFPVRLSLDDTMADGVPAVFEALPAGAYTLFVEDRHRCRLEQFVEVGAPPPLLIDAGADQTVELGDRVELRPSVNQPLSNFQWLPAADYECLDSDCLSVAFFPQASGTYYLEGGNGIDCQARDSLRVEVLDVRRVYIPTAFSPNDDGRNDTFTPYVQSPNVQEIIAFRVFDRWGALVHEQRNYLPEGITDGWDGRQQGRAMKAGVYTYTVEVLFLDGEVGRYAGGVQLVR